MAEEGTVISCHSLDAWNEQLQKGNDSKKLVRFSLILMPSFLILSNVSTTN